MPQEVSDEGGGKTFTYLATGRERRWAEAVEEKRLSRRESIPSVEDLDGVYGMSVGFHTEFVRKKVSLRGDWRLATEKMRTARGICIDGTVVTGRVSS
jgi:hypothetical protein